MGVCVLLTATTANSLIWLLQNTKMHEMILEFFRTAEFCIEKPAGRGQLEGHFCQMFAPPSPTLRFNGRFTAYQLLKISPRAAEMKFCASAAFVYC